MNWFPILLVVHIALAISLLAPSLLLPFLLRRADAAGGTEPGTVTGLLMRLQGTGSLVIGAGLALTGIGLLVLLGTQLLTQFWLLAGLVLYVANLLVAAFISRPNLRRLVGLQANADDETWRRRARQQRYVAYGMAAMVGVIGLLMMNKPTLW